MKKLIITDEFKVIPWIRRIRADHAARQSALSDTEKMEQDRQAAARIMPRFFRRRAESHINHKKPCIILR